MSVGLVPVYEHRQVVMYAIVDGDVKERLRGRKLHRNPQKGYLWVRPERGAPAVFLHRFVMNLCPGDGLQVDHINRNKQDNRRVNLRLASAALNGQNRGFDGHGASAYRGVRQNAKGGRFFARAVANGVAHYLGTFDLEEQAAQAVVDFWAHLAVA